MNATGRGQHKAVGCEERNGRQGQSMMLGKTGILTSPVELRADATSDLCHY